MCLAIPMRVIEIEGFNARCEAKGIERTVSLFLMQHDQVSVGDMVLIHVGYAIQKVSEEEARTAWDLLDEVLEASDGPQLPVEELGGNA
jgi:hydrogenase expression/formation protein HypC